jgi:hypothetical protein
MRLRRLLSAVCAAVTLHGAAFAQDWTDEQLVAACGDFQQEGLAARYAQVAKLLAAGVPAQAAIAARLHGDHREYQLKIERLIANLADARWQVREDAERQLIEIGGRAWTEIQATKEASKVIDQQIRCARVLDALAAKGTESEDRERRLLRGLVTTALSLDADDRLRRALRSALGHTNSAIAAGAVRALGKHGGDEDALAVAALASADGAQHRAGAISALARMRSAKALELCAALLFPTGAAGPLGAATADRAEAMAIVRGLRSRDDDGAKALLARLQSHPDPVVAAGARVALPPATTTTQAKLTLSPDRASVEASLPGALGDAIVVAGAFPAPAAIELTIAECDAIEFPAHAMRPAAGARLFLEQGSLVVGEVLAITADAVRVRSARFGELSLPRAGVQGIAFDPALDRLVGASVEHDRVRMRDGSTRDGAVTDLDAAGLRFAAKDGAAQVATTAEVAGVLFTRPRTTTPDPLTYTRLDLVDGERLIGFLAACNAEHVVVSVPQLGAVAMPWRDVARVELGVGGGALWGFTLIADYSDNRVLEVDDQGRVVFELKDVFGAWDAECLDNGNLLITEYAISRVQEVDRKGNQVWAFEDLNNPYDADRLPNGNTLIADTFASRVVEVDKDGKVVWTYAKEVRPLDVDRLPNGNTLIADATKERVLEVTPAGEIAWELKGLPSAHDVDRLQNGHTLVTLRSKGVVQEFDRDGKLVFEITGLNSPSDADRLPNGNTLVAENTRVREFDRRGNEIWRQAVQWAVEVNRY